MHYESALEPEPNSQLYAFNLGTLHTQLSTQDGRYLEHFEEAGALLQSVEQLGSQPWEADAREAARIALCALYLRWDDQPQDATSAYERALARDPNSEETRGELDRLWK